MKFARLFFILYLAGFHTGCSQIYNVSYDYNESFKIVQISTYNWLPIPEEANINSLDAMRIKQAVNTELKAKGLVLTSENPGLLISPAIVTQEKLRITNWGYPYYYSYWIYDGFWAADYYQYEEGTFILDFFEPNSKNLIWRGTAKVALDYANTPAKRDKLIKEAMHKILRNYPPPAK